MAKEKAAVRDALLVRHCEDRRRRSNPDLRAWNGERGEVLWTRNLWIAALLSVARDDDEGRRSLAMTEKVKRSTSMTMMGKRSPAMMF